MPKKLWRKRSSGKIREVHGNPTFRSGKLAVDYDHVETRGVLGGAYLPRHFDDERPTFLTHLVFIGPAPRYEELRTGCRQPVDNVVDVYGHSQEESAARPTCPTCAKKWEKVPPELRGAPDDRFREPNGPSLQRAIFRELRRAASRVAPWKPSSTKAYIIDVAHEAGVEVSEAAPVLLALQKVTSDLMSRIDLVAAADPKKLRASTIEDGRFGGVQLIDLDVLKHASYPKSLVANHPHEVSEQPVLSIGRRVLRYVDSPRISYAGLVGAKILGVGPRNVRVRAVVRFSPTGPWHEQEHRVPREDILETVSDDGTVFRDREDELEPNGGYYVWIIDEEGQPLLEGPYGPHDLERAKAQARIGATEGRHDRAVSLGLRPTEKTFKIVRQYEAGTGKRLL